MECKVLKRNAATLRGTRAYLETLRIIDESEYTFKEVWAVIASAREYTTFSYLILPVHVSNHDKIALSSSSLLPVPSCLQADWPSMAVVNSAASIRATREPSA